MITDDPIPDWKFLFPCSITHYDTVQKFCTSTILIILFTLVSKFMLYLQPPRNFVEIIAYFDFTIKCFIAILRNFNPSQRRFAKMQRSETEGLNMRFRKMLQAFMKNVCSSKFCSQVYWLFRHFSALQYHSKQNVQLLEESNKNVHKTEKLFVMAQS